MSGGIWVPPPATTWIASKSSRAGEALWTMPSAPATRASTTKAGSAYAEYNSTAGARTSLLIRRHNSNPLTRGK